MSVLNSWANQYTQLANVTDAINESVQILIKDKQVHQYPQLADQPGFQLQDEAVQEARTTVAHLIENLMAPVASEPEVAYRTAALPDDVLDEYRSRLGQNRTARRRFEKLYEVLQADEPVRDTDKPALDDLVITLDNSRKEIFQKLRQSGG
ncbi:hypothetical protein [Fibrella aquatilis]|uniref:Uncharacterized protein n=1 Tax=Fibrella aquatilis TaxID=2817059 RepID=A0A939JZ76_9BACT|nr:hypothetical protein [Fibrella aquatilis]MBO0931133.1 hypothetical protein [Fibrella aquatilis]